MAHRSPLLLALVCLLGISRYPFAQQTGASLSGTVISQDSSDISGATVKLCTADCQTATTNDDGFYQFHNVAPGTYTLNVTASGFGTYKRSITVGDEKFIDLPVVELKIPEVQSSVTALTPREQAIEEVRAEEKQRILGFFPNFYVSYDPHPAPLSVGQKFHLAYKTTIDPTTPLFAAIAAGIQQQSGIYAGDRRPDGTYTGWGYGGEAYAKRFGANMADAYSATFISNAILPSLFHQDPRYIYQGTGSTKSRAWHAIASAFVCPGDNGNKQFNYSFVLGNFMAAGLSNAYYPASDRGAKLTFVNAALNTVSASAGALIQEFVLDKITSRHKKN